jgi:hypothetical protein
MNIEDIQKENNQRLEILHNQHMDWLMSIGYNITKNRELSRELISDLFLYLAEKGNPNLWYLDSFNLMYCHSFIKSRFLNQLKTKGRTEGLPNDIEEWDIPYIEYDYESDMKLETAYTEVQDEIRDLQKTKMWASARLAEIYLYSDKTLEGVSNDIGVSKSTSYLHVKRIKKHLKETIQNPFK